MMIMSGQLHRYLIRLFRLLYPVSQKSLVLQTLALYDLNCIKASSKK